MASPGNKQDWYTYDISFLIGQQPTAHFGFDVVAQWQAQQFH